MTLPKFLAAGWRDRARETRDGQRPNAFAHDMIEMTRDEYEAFVKATNARRARKSVAAAE
ncbi:hypothetical protein D3C83_289810 [compost metagenome]